MHGKTTMRMPTAESQRTGTFVSCLRIRKLFGYFDYDIQPKPKAEEAFKTLVVLYGLNGTGKTTILRLLYHLLSPRERAGHKSFAAKTKFQLFQIGLSDGTEITASRPAATDGPFTLSLRRPGGKTILHEFRTVGKPPTILPDPREPRTYGDLLAALESLGYTFYYLADDRTFSIEPEDLPRRRFIQHESVEPGMRYLSRLPEREDREGIVQALEQALSRFNMFVSRQASYQSRTGAAFTHSVYADVITRIVKRPTRGRRSPVGSLDDQVSQLRAIAADSAVLETYGLSTRVDVEPLIKTIEKAPASRQRIARELLSPYLGALDQRFGELRLLHDLIHSFVGHLSTYLAPKKVLFSVQDGLVLLSPSGDRLSADMLSSGERHLLLIMCNTCIATSSHTLFIIDEPEISLNIVWQRTLLSTLLDMAAGSTVQFLLASHSIPLVTQHRTHVVELSQVAGE